jgi:hypothetical protein
MGWDGRTSRLALNAFVRLAVHLLV